MMENKNGNICCLCECAPSDHFIGWKCPLFEGEWLCGHCCILECLRLGVENRFSEKLGKKITREEIDRICAECGKNYAKINDALADRMEHGGKEDEANTG